MATKIPKQQLKERIANLMRSASKLAKQRDKIDKQLVGGDYRTFYGLAEVQHQLAEKAYWLGKYNTLLKGK